jgi:hypothetical protein
MTSKEFLEKKNELVKRVTGLVLVPEDQLEEHPFVKLDTRETGATLMSGICTYCRTYDNCNECLMAIADNRCGNISRSTWWEANYAWETKATDADRTELMELVNKYNEEKGK